ncbi:hypothetical protein [Phytomonospora endophytica]|uniref:Uncharacterized protein n=1 Tax=Phytomonospora endophytica TaxID=714109 RepID=A0A841FUP8_9ACTN|nr:hypothetical protein [Phytomonospora endophytica]MBB6039736.1 hypothetical protein [Phytomonospora endophytica]GIG70928.1 hypothetical protein Pen01_72230 [Phytomonospora endophytica]
MTANARPAPAPPVLIAAAGGLAYVASKLHFAASGELGIAGFYAMPEAQAAFGDATAAQLGNAAIGLVAVLVVLALLRPPRHRLARLALLAANWAGALMIGAGVVGFILRAAGATSSVDWAPTGWQAWATLAVGAAWVAGWLTALLVKR